MKYFHEIFILFICLLCFQTANAAWTKIDSKTLAWFKDVYFVNEKLGWIAGSDGMFLETANGGRNWKQVPKFTNDTIRQIHFSDENHGWLLCERDRFNRGTNLPTYTLRTTDGGINWEKMEFAKEGREFVTKIIFDKYGNATAFGEAGIFYTLQLGDKEWKKDSQPIKYLMFDGTFNGSDKAVIVGAGGTILFTEDSGENWSNANIFGDRTTKLNAVFFVNQQNGWTVGANGKIFQTVGGGKNWREQKTNINADLNDVCFISTAEGWAVGDEGKILHTQTGGNVWVSEKSDTNYRLEKVFFNGRKGWAVGFGGTILNFN